MTLLNNIKAAARKLPLIRELVEERDRLRAEIETKSLECEHLREASRASLEELNENKRNQGFVPPGHFYSPVPCFDEIRKNAAKTFEGQTTDVPGVEFNTTAQLTLLHHCLPFYSEMPFSTEKKDGLRYYYNNPAYSYSDAILLHCMIRHLEPRRIVEVGSGYSSCMILDTNELYFDGKIETTFIEPYPDLLYSLLKDSDRENIKLIPSRLQEVDASEFSALQANDVLFIDSTHVSKIDSDVNRILFDILPILAPGVCVHFHDIFFPFEYPKKWLLEGRAWNEAYLLRAFLQYNREFSIILMNTYMDQFHREFFDTNMPLCLENPGGSIWLRKGKADNGSL